MKAKIVHEKIRRGSKNYVRRLNVKVVKTGPKDWRVQFGFGSQFFYIDYGRGDVTKRDSEWTAKMLRLCFANYKKSLVAKQKMKP